MVVTEQDEREQLEEAEVEVVPTECELEILVVDVVNEILEVLCCSSNTSRATAAELASPHPPRISSSSGASGR